MKNRFEEELNKIKIPEELHDRCMKGIDQAKRSNPKQKREAIKGLTDKWFAAAAIVICVAALVFGSRGNDAIGGSVKGFFRDITNRTGAVTGVEYEEADKEVSVNIEEAVKNGDTVTLDIEVVFEDPDDVPFSESEEVSVENAVVLDENGTKIAESVFFPQGKVIDGKARIQTEFDGSNISAGKVYTLAIESITSHKKADAPMEMHGTWECGFTVE